MTATIRTPAVVRPWHLWMVALLYAALHVGGARDYLLVIADDTGYPSRQFAPGGIEFFAGYPLVLRVLWMVSIVAGLLVPCLLLGLSRWAVPVAAVCAATQAVLLVVTFGFQGRWEALGAATSWFDLGVGVVIALIAGYCWAQRHRGLLR